MDRTLIYMLIPQIPLPADISTGFARFLPTLFVGKAFWRHSWRWVAPAFETAILERTVWYLGGFWVGLLMNVGTPRVEYRK